MKKLAAVILAMVMVLSLCVAVNAKASVFVAPDGLDSNDGSMTAPFATLQKAVDAVDEGGVIYLREGTYSEGANLKSGITIKPYNNEKVIFSAAQSAVIEEPTKEEKEYFRSAIIKDESIRLGNINNVGILSEEDINPALLDNGVYQRMSLNDLEKKGEWTIKDGKVFFYPETKPKKLEYISARTIYINGNEINKVKISGIEFSKTIGKAINLQNCTNVEITNCVFSYISDTCVNLENGSNIKISNCEFKQNAGQAIVLTGKDCEIDNCGFDDNSMLQKTEYPVLYINGDNNTLSNSEITNSPVEGLHLGGSGNTVAKSTFSTIAVVNGDGVVRLLDGATNNVIKHNRFFDLARTVSEYESNVTNINLTDVYIKIYSRNVTNYGKILHNELNGISTTALNSIYISCGADGTEITNNVFDNVNVCVYLEGSDNNAIKSNIFNSTGDYVKLEHCTDKETFEKNNYENNRITDNIVCDQDEIFVSKDMKDNGNVVENNLKAFKSKIFNRDGSLNEASIKEKDPDFEILNFEEVGRYEVVKEESVFDTGIMLLIGSDNVSARGVVSKIDASARIVDGRTLVPVRYISEAFGEKVLWDDATKTVTVGDSISIVLGKPSIMVNGKEQKIDVPAAIYDSRTFVPLRAIAEALGKSVFWDDRGLIVITDTQVTITADEAGEYIEKLK